MMQIVGLGWIRISILCSIFATCSSSTFAQSGSSGGTIGNDDKSVSGTRKEPRVPRPAKPTETRRAKSSVQSVSSPSDIAVSSHCPITGATGIGEGSTFESARAEAIRSCVGKGGIFACCSKYTEKIAK
jgi:hypothetical protein